MSDDLLPDPITLDDLCDPNKCPPHITKCKDWPQGYALLEFSDCCPIPFQVLCALNTKAGLCRKGLKLGWCLGQRAVSISSERVQKIIEGKDDCDILTLCKILGGDLGS